MRRYKIIWLSLVGLLLGCHDDIVDKYGHDLKLVEIGAEISQQYITRASDGGFADGDQIGVFIVNRNNGESPTLKPTGNHADNVCYTYNEADHKWTGSYQLYWKDKNTPVDAYGYYPFDASLESTQAYPYSVQRNQRDQLTTGRKLSGYEQSDFLWAKAENVSPGTPIHLKHHHLMAGIKVVLTEGDGFEAGEWNAIEKSVLVENTIGDATINLQEGTVSITGSTTTTIIPQKREQDYRAVVIPQTVAANTSLFSITIDGKSYQFTRDEAMTYNSGKLHQFSFDVQKSLETGDYILSLLSESITPWETDPESHNGEAREYLTIHINEGEFIGDIIDNLGVDPAKIVNLKVTGCCGGGEFGYIREKMTSLEALNMKELRIKNVTSYYWEGGWGPLPYDQPTHADDYIPEGAFENMASLRYFVWPDSLKGIGDMAFPGSGLCGSLILPEGLKHIGSNAFVAYNHRSNYGLNGELYIPSTVEYIGNNAFGAYDGNRELYFTGELILPTNMKYLGSGAFAGCPYMTGAIHVPEGITEFNNAWPDQIGGPCIIPQGVKRINDIPRGATHIYIPEGVESIGEWASWGGSKLYCSVHLPSTLQKIERAAFCTSALTHVNLPEGIEIIEDRVFDGCGNLQDTITIPSTVTQIRSGAFANCHQLTAVILPAGLQGIQGEAFANCFSLDYIECLGAEPPAIEENTFSGVEKNNYTVVVPEGAVEAYKNAPHWCEFKRISAYRNFVCRPMKAKLLNKSNVRDVVLNANDSWSVSDCPSWIHVSPTSGYKKTELKITIDEMPHNQGNREGAVTFKLGRNDEDGNPITCTYTVQQFDYEYEEDGVFELQKATKGQRGGIDILFVGDGYDAEDIAKGDYLSDMEQETEYFFAVEPYKTYKDYFNVSIAMAMSYESGVVDSPDKWRNTKFGVTWGAGNGRLNVPFDDIASYVLKDITNGPITESNVSRSLIICVPNSSAYEGVTAMYGDGSAIAVCPMSKLDYPNDARGLIQHEAGGHGWGKLDDEYIYHREYIQKCGCICCSHVEGVEAMHAMGWGRNLSLTGKYKNIEWRHLIFDNRYDDICDIYEGGHMHARGIYRSELNSCMNNNVPYFSTWSRQIIVERIKEAAGETFDFETFVSNDSREYGDKFLTRGLFADWAVKAMHSEHHGPVIRNGSPIDYIKKGGRRR